MQNQPQIWHLSMEHFYQTDPQASSKDFDPSQIEPKTDQAPNWQIQELAIFLNIRVAENV